MIGSAGSSFPLGSVLGFEIRIDYSWFVIFFLIFWSLAFGVFPAELPERSTGAYLVMGGVGTVLFFASLLAHELSHSVVARSKGIPVEGITLFIFGGIARTRLESETPDDELQIAGIGPLTSVVLGGAFLGLAWLAGQIGAGEGVVRIAWYLGVINIVLAVFNLLPGFPLDGGRLFRALVWKRTGDLTKATRWASSGGKWFGYGLMGLGILQMFGGAVIGGLWLVFIGWFLRSAAEMSLRQHLLRHVLDGVRARDVMSAHPETVAPDLPLRKLVDEHFLRSRYQSFPVVEGERLVGLVTLDHVKEAPRGEWDRTPVRDVMESRRDELTVRAEEPMTEVLEKMQGSGTRRVLVVADGELQGIISGSDVAGWIRRAQELGELAEGR